MGKRAFVSSRAIYQVIRGMFTGSYNYITSVRVAATEVTTTEVTNWFSLRQSIVILQDPSVFCTDQTGELKGDVVEITIPSILQFFLIALIFVIPKKGNAKEHSNYCTITSHASKEMPKILQARLQQYMNCELPDVQAGFRKARGTRYQIANIRWIIKKAREFKKTSTFALLSTPKPLTVWITTNCGKFFKRWEYQTT